MVLESKGHAYELRRIRRFLHRLLFRDKRKLATLSFILPSAFWGVINNLRVLIYSLPIFNCFRTNGIPYFSVVFKQLDKLLADEVVSFLNQHEHPDASYTRLIFSVYLEVKDLAAFHQHLPSGGDHKLLLVRCHEWFEPSVSCWLSVCKVKALQRVSESNSW